MNVVKIVFSPTGGTQKVADALAEELARGRGSISQIDLSDPAMEKADLCVDADALAVIAAPCFAGRVPALVLERLAKVASNGAKAVVTAPLLLAIRWLPVWLVLPSTLWHISLPRASLVRIRLRCFSRSRSRFSRRFKTALPVTLRSPAISPTKIPVLASWFPSQLRHARHAVPAPRYVPLGQLAHCRAAWQMRTFALAACAASPCAPSMLAS